MNDYEVLHEAFNDPYIFNIANDSRLVYIVDESNHVDYDQVFVIFTEPLIKQDFYGQLKNS